MGLTTIATDIWVYGSFERIMAGAQFPARTTVVRLGDAGLLLYAPLAIDDALAAELAALGTVRFLVGPNAFHYRYLAAAKARYPDAELWLSPALKTKRPELTADHWLTEAPPAAWDGHLRAATLAGSPKISETMLLHLPSKTLIVADLVFHIHETRGWLASTLLRMVGARGRLAQSAMMRMLTSDKQAAAASARDVLTWDFERVVMAHGQIVEGADARAQLEAGLAKMLAWSA